MALQKQLLKPDLVWIIFMQIAQKGSQLHFSQFCEEYDKTTDDRH